MASQLRKVTGNRRLRSDPRAGLQAKISSLPGRLAQKQQREVIKRDTAFQNKQIKLQKKSAAQRLREQEAAMGLEAGKLGVNIAMSDMGKKTVGDIFGGGQKAIQDVKSKFGGKPTAKPIAPKTGGVYNVNVGGALASGLTGYGVGKLVGGKNKGKKAMYGAGAGALTGMLTSGQGQGISGLLAGGLSGGLGGYFS